MSTYAPQSVIPFHEILERPEIPVWSMGQNSSKVLRNYYIVDYEDIATTMIDGESFILVLDTGNNDFDRDPLSVLKFKEQALNGDITIPRSDIEEIQVRYEGFRYDCEALGKIIIF